MESDTRTVPDPSAVRELALRIAKADADNRPVVLSGWHDDDAIRRVDQSYLEDACSYDLFDLQDSGLVAA